MLRYLVHRQGGTSQSQPALGDVTKPTGKLGKWQANVRKFASAHDLRRAFGQRWSAKIKPTQLREPMRHASINKTLAYYVGENDEATADALWAAVGDTLGDTPSTNEKRDAKSIANSSTGERT